MKKDHHTGIYLLPNLLTTASLFAAFYSIVASMKSHFDTAVIAIFVGMIADGMDGRIARLTNTQSAFGAEYDSLADMVTFGVAPALLLYSSHLYQLGKFGWLIAFIYTAAVALRLARFNTQIDKTDKKYFQGLACPSAAAMLAAFVWICHQNNWNTILMDILTALLTLFAAVLMVSNVRYYSFKVIDFKGRIPFLYVLFVVIVFVAIAVNPAIVLFLAFLSYALSGPLQTLVAIHRVRKQRKRSKK